MGSSYQGPANNNQEKRIALEKKFKFIYMDNNRQLQTHKSYTLSISGCISFRIP